MLQSFRLLLRALEPGDLNATYLGWLNDPAVNRYLETRFLPQTLEALQAYWQAHRDDPASPWFAICLAADGRHIGNIKLGPIQWLHRRADLSLFIGDRGCWGRVMPAKRSRWCATGLFTSWICRSSMPASMPATSVAVEPLRSVALN